MATHRYAMRRYASGLNFDTGTDESFHKEVVGKVYRTDCNREENRDERLAMRADHNMLIKTVTDAGMADPVPRRRRIFVMQPKVHILSKTLSNFLSRKAYHNTILSTRQVVCEFYLLT